MAALERHAELDRLRASWTDAIHVVRLATPRTPDWNEARLVERHKAAEYLSELADPDHELPADEDHEPTSNL